MSIGDRMKSSYEDRTRFFLPRRTYTIVRVDGKAFHTYTRQMARPFDEFFMTVMNRVAVALCAEMQGAKLAYVQSDEISVVMTDFDARETEAWFDGNVQKIASIAASTATAVFIAEKRPDWGYPRFDARAFTIPPLDEVVNYLIWRQQDATRNSIQMAGHAEFSHKEMNGLNTDQIQEKLFKERGINWASYPDGFKRGRCVVRRVPPGGIHPGWTVEAPPIFTQDREYLMPHLQVTTK